MKVFWALFCGAACALAFPVVTNAQSGTCAQSYEKAQEEKSEGHLNAAIAELRVCVDSACPEFIREDCKRWLNQTEAELPTVVFSVTRDGKDEVESELFCDDDLLTGVLDGKAVSIDPGFHVFTVRIRGASPMQRKLLIREGERNRIVEFEFHSPPQSSVAPTVTAPDQTAHAAPVYESNRSRAYWTYGLSGAAVLGWAGFSLFGALGKSEKADLERNCAPYCQTSQVDSVRTKYLIADTCLGVGIVSLGIATYLYVSSRGKNRAAHDEAPASVQVVAQPRGAGGVVRFSRPF